VRSVRRLGIPGLVTVAVIVAAGGYWLFKIRDRTNEAAVDKAVAGAHTGATARCVELRSNGAAWLCAVVYQAESECVLAKASVFGSVSQGLSDRCSKNVDLQAALPHPTPQGVADDIDRIVAAGGSRACVKLAGTSAKWACAVPGELAVTCVLVKVRPWTVWTPTPGGVRCEHVPALRRA
jgi:hypothetical protein